MNDHSISGPAQNGCQELKYLSHKLEMKKKCESRSGILRTSGFQDDYSRVLSDSTLECRMLISTLN